MLYMKSCPRCHGDVQFDSDNFGAFAKCLQCGFNRDFQTRREDVAPQLGIVEAGSAFGPAIIAPEIPGEDDQLEAA